MSISLQNTLRERKWFGYSLPRKQKFEKRIYADSYTINHMSQERELAGHGGCVNSLDWSLNGDKLLTGSDDTHLCVYDTYNDYKLTQIIHTGHRANIFSAKFMPQTSEKRIVSCAGDSEIRIFDNGEPIQMYVCHHDQTKRICVYHDNPNEFLTCSQDGTVRHFDLRVPHICTPHSVKSFMTTELKPAKQTIVDESARKGCSQPIVDYSRYRVELNGLSINQRAPHYFAVAGMSNYIYLHDRRMVGGASPPATSSSSSSNDIMESTRCVKRFTSGISDRWSNNHITACQFAKSNSEELIGSWSSDAIYLFNINDEPPIDNTARVKPTYATALRPKPNDSSPSFTNAYSEIKRLIRENKMMEAHEKLQPFIHIQYSAPIKIIIKSLTALFSLHTFHEKYREFVSNHHVDDSLLLQLDQYVSDAHDAMTDAMVEQHKYPDDWYCKWYLAIGYYLASGGPTSFCHVVRKQFLQISLRYLQKTISHQGGHEEMVMLFSTELKRASLVEGCWPDDARITDEFIRQHEQQDSNNVNNEQEDDSDDDDEMTLDDARWKWLDYLYIDGQHEDNRDDIMTTEEDEENEEEDEDDNMLSDTSTQSDQEDDISMYTEIFSSRGIRDIIEVSDSSDVESDFEAYRGYGISNRKIVNEDVDVVTYRSKYKGHCNIETIKDVDFFGPNDEYIVSGSDGGDLFIWDKKSARILQILQADSEIVNVAKGHPTLPLIAVSGIDSTAKIFSPMTRPITKSKLTEPNNSLSYSSSSRMFAQEEIIQRNEENNENLEDHMNITRNMIAVLTHFQRTYRRRQQSDSDHSSDNSEEDEL